MLSHTIQKKLKQWFLRGQRSNLENAWFILTLSNEAIQIPNESPFFMLQDGVFKFKKRANMGKLQGIE